jgi:hypothetical protein
VARLGIVSSVLPILASSPLASQPQLPKNASAIGPPKRELASLQLLAPTGLWNPDGTSQLGNVTQSCSTRSYDHSCSAHLERDRNATRSVTLKPDEVVSFDLQQAVTSVASHLVSQKCRVRLGHSRLLKNVN